MEYAEYDTEVRFSYRSYPSSDDEANPPQRNHDGDEDADSDPGILGAFTSILVGGVTELLADFTPNPSTPAVERYATTASNNSDDAAPSSNRATTTTTVRSKLASAGGEARHRVVAAATSTASSSSSSVGAGSHNAATMRAGSNMPITSHSRGGGSEDNGWMISSQQHSGQPIKATSASARSRAGASGGGGGGGGGGSGDVPPANSLVGSPSAGGSGGGLLGVMFSGISSLGQRATDLLTQLDHDFENIFNGSLDESDDADGTDSAGADSDSNPRVGAVDQSRRREKGSSECGSAVNVLRSSRTSLAGKEGLGIGGRMASSNAATAHALSARGVTATPIGQHGGRAGVHRPPSKAATTVHAFTSRSTGGNAAGVIVNGGRMRNAERGRSYQLEDKVRLSANKLWDKRSDNDNDDDDDNWGWGSSESDTGRARGGKGTLPSGAGGVSTPQPQPLGHTHAHARVQRGMVTTKAVSVGLQQMSSPGGSTAAAAKTVTAAVAAAASPRGSRVAASSCTSGATSASRTPPSSVRSSRSSVGKLFIIKPAASTAAGARADSVIRVATPTPVVATGTLASGTGPAAASGPLSASPMKKTVKKDAEAASLLMEASPARKAAASVRHSVSSAAGAQLRELSSKGSPLPSKPPSVGPSPQPVDSPRPPCQIQSSRADQGCKVEAKTEAGAAEVLKMKVGPAVLFDGFSFVAEAKAAVKAMETAAKSTQRELQQQLEDTRHRADAAEARCAELQLQLEAAVAETVRLGSLAKLLEGQLEASQKRCEELMTENAQLSATAAHIKHPVSTADAACSPEPEPESEPAASCLACDLHLHTHPNFAATTAAVVAAAATTTAVSPVGYLSDHSSGGHSSGGHSRHGLNHGGGGGGISSSGGSDELVEAALVAQLTAAMADKARLSRENDILTRRLEGLQELLSFTAQQAAYADGYGCEGEDGYDCVRYGMEETARYEMSGAPHWHFADPLGSTTSPEASPGTAAAAAAAAAVKVASSFGTADDAAAGPTAAYTDLCTTGAEAWGGDYKLFVERGSAGVVGTPDWQYDNAGGTDGVERAAATDAASGLGGVTTSIATCGALVSAPGNDVAAAASGGATHAAASSLSSPGCVPRAESSPGSQQEQPYGTLPPPPPQQQQQQQQQQPALLMPQLEQLDEQHLSTPAPRPPPLSPPKRTDSYPDGWEVLDAAGEAVTPPPPPPSSSESPGPISRSGAV